MSSIKPRTCSLKSFFIFFLFERRQNIQNDFTFLLLLLLAWISLNPPSPPPPPPPPPRPHADPTPYPPPQTTRISDNIHNKVLDIITYALPKFNGAAVEVGEWISIFIPYFTWHVVIYPSMLWLKLIWVDKKGLSTHSIELECTGIKLFKTTVESITSSYKIQTQCK